MTSRPLDATDDRIELLENSPAGDDGRIEQLLASRDELHAPFLRLLTHLEFSDEEAKRHWDSIMRHRRVLATKLGRDAGLQVTALDYFQNLMQELRAPKLIELAAYLATERNAVTDGLTGLFNRHYFDSSLHRETKRAHRYGLSFSLVMLDLDNFKEVNDTHGHLAGDRALSACSDVIRQSVREIDVACRYGGEEFALILPETSRDGAFIVSERIRADVEELSESKLIRDVDIDLSVSGGVTLYPTDAATPDTLVLMADRALYRSKGDGKNRITLHAEEKRRSPRFEARKLLVFKEPRNDQELRSQTKNLSRSRALVESKIPLTIGSELEIGITVPQSNAHFDLRGRVVRLEEASGEDEDTKRYNIGIAFVAETDEQARQIERLASEIYRPLSENKGLPG